MAFILADDIRTLSIFDYRVRKYAATLAQRSRSIAAPVAALAAASGDART
jgi:hypothetical protein